MCTAVYDTRALANEKAIWPASGLALHLGDAGTFGNVTRRHVLEAGVSLGLNERTATRELDRLCNAVLTNADQLLADPEAEMAIDVAKSPKPDEAKGFMASDLAVLKAMRCVVMTEMRLRLAHEAQS